MWQRIRHHIGAVFPSQETQPGDLTISLAVAVFPEDAADRRAL